MSVSLASVATTTTTYASAIPTKWALEILKTAEGYLVADRFAVKKVHGRGEGGTIRVNRLLRPTKKLTAESASTIYNAGDAIGLTSNYLDITPVKFGESFGFTDDTTIEAFVEDKDNRDKIAGHMARSVEYQIIKRISTKCLRHLIDKDSTKQVIGFPTSGVTATALVDTARTEADDIWNGGFITFVAPAGGAYDQTYQVTDFVAATDTLTIDTMQNLPVVTTSKYSLSVGTNLVATDILTSAALMDVAARHEVLETEKFDGNLLRAFVHSAQKRDLQGDIYFVNNANYDASSRMGKYSLVRFADIECLVSSELYRESVAGVEDQSTGLVHVSPIFGANAYCVVRWGMGQGDLGVEFYTVDKPDAYNLRMGAKWISWKAKFGREVLRSTSIIGLMTGATSLNLVTQ